MSRLGADVVGIDASKENIETARFHQPSDLKNLIYEHTSVEDFSEKQSNVFDGVVLSEIVEHVNDLPLFLNHSCSLIKVYLVFDVLFI